MSSPPIPSQSAVARAIRLSYVQAMIGAVYGASTGGMFLIGYALKLGASNVQIGLMITIPMFCVVSQLASSALVERGVSRRRMTILGASLNVSGWTLIILIPYIAAQATANVKISALISVITLVTLFAFVSGNARGSWIGDLIPAASRGRFFGRITMYACIVGTVFALLEGTFLDFVKPMGIKAYSWLFGFGMIFGLINILLFAPQADVPLAKREDGGGFLAMVRETFANGPLMTVVVYALFWSMQSIAGPFYTTYMLRDLGMPFLGIGIITAAYILSMLSFSPLWGKLVDHYGCRPVLVACTAFLIPWPLIWLGLTTPGAVYATVIPVNLMTGFMAAGVSVALSTLIYKVTPSAGRSVQFAVYQLIVTLLAAPMPTLGGSIPALLNKVGMHVDLRATFTTVVPIMIAASLAALRIKEPGARPPRELVRDFPSYLRRPWMP